MPTTPPDTTHEHPEQHLRSSALLTDVVIGMSDGLTVPFALAAGLSGAVVSNDTIVIACLAATAVGSIAMGVGGFMSGKTAQEHYNGDEQHEEAGQFFANIGLGAELQEQATGEMARDKDRWAQFMMQYELEPGAPNPKRARNSGLTIGLSYILGGLVPLGPYFFMGNPIDALKVSALVTLVCLFMFGYFKSRATGVHPWGGALRVMLVGAVAAACAFGVGKLI